MLGSDAPLSLAAAGIPFLTLLGSDVAGPRRRERLVLRGGNTPPWLAGVIDQVPIGECAVVASAGRREAGSTVRIRSIVVFRERASIPETAYVYVEEWNTGARLTDRAHPVHVVRCAALPLRVHFVEVPHSSPRRAELRSV